ncbi:hypothetical protein [Flavobacterium selenitireducens]|uniref:hypothetical protein n=1 Tax=Flavobacterium selenitireducens TaxID=2722704 RepID=UPI00168B0831|nr:hypothetical protein [Flavobacterium selenitireducens]MBD3581691.1 hypothetical protein [Flavobacterium selenitireducens]
MKNCAECGDKLSGREDKKFCSDGCRNVFNNKINKDSNNFMRNINNLLRRNYRILTQLNTNGATTASRAELVNMGFDFEYVTGIRTTKKGKTYYFLYDHGYHKHSGDDFRLIRKET